MKLSFAARIVGLEIHCEIGSDTALAAPVFCSSLFVPIRVVAGGTLVKSVGGYAEVALRDIAAGGRVTVILTHVEAFVPQNRAWLPLGAYLRTRGGTVALPVLEAGVRFLGSPPMTAPDFGGLKIVPQPTDWLPSGGVLKAAGFVSGDPRLAPVAALAGRLNFAPILGPQGAVLDIVNDLALPVGGYRLEIGTAGITLAAEGDSGLFSAAITLLNLRETYDGALPCGILQDAPRFGWRGQHLDCARHFYAVETILRLLDMMALLKLNRFHWHFSDDEAFRLEVDCAPEIWQRTAQRGEGQVVPGVFGGGILSGGSYSRTDVALVLARAQELQIEVLPEIEVPAHAFALNLAYQGMRDPGDNAPTQSIQGYPENILNPAMPTTWALLEPLALEVASLFPLGILHLGCDELPPEAWAGSPAVAALKAAHGLQTRDDVQGWMMAKLAGFLSAHGIRPAAWEEAAKGVNGGIGHDALLFSWTGQGPGVAAARAGHDVVMCPAQNVYFDMAHSGAADDWGASWAAIVALEDVVNWLPVPAGAEDVADRIVGVEGCFWSEFTTRDAEMEPMLVPRILGLANKAWDRKDSLDGVGLRGLAQSYAAVFDRMGWQRNRSA